MPAKNVGHARDRSGPTHQKSGEIHRRHGPLLRFVCSGGTSVDNSE